VVRVGQVVGAFGIAGAVKVLPLTDFDDRFGTGSQLLLGGASRRVEWSRKQAPVFVVKFSDLDSRTLAETFRGSYLEVADEDIRQLPAGRWYHHQLIGLRVATESGEELGTLTSVLDRPANDVWVVAQEGEEHLVPATQDAVLDVDLEAGRVTVADWLFRVEEA
jgi:16S rRNA processing protein RimM